MYPRLLHIYGPLWIQSYGVMIAIGFLVFLFLTLRHPLRKKLISRDLYLNAIFVGLASAIIGGRTLYVLLNLNEFSHNWLELFYPWVGGFVVLGAIIGVLIGGPAYLYKHKIPVLPILDLAAMYAPLMHAISRFGCLFAGCCYGAQAQGLLWAITFTNPEAHAPLCVPLHPTQIYMSIASLLIFFILRLLSPILLKRPGATAFGFLMLENISRFTIDFWRGDRQPNVQLLGNAIGISEVQLLSALSFIVASTCFMWFLLKKRSQ